jgi:hypothetical protein
MWLNERKEEQKCLGLHRMWLNVQKEEQKSHGLRQMRPIRPNVRD